MSRKPGRIRKVLKVMGIGLLALLLLYTVAAFALSWEDRRKAVRDADAGYDDLAPQGELWARDMAAALSPALGDPLGEVEHLLCGTGEAYGGWFVTDHRHRCDLLRVQLYRSPDDVTAARDALAGDEFDLLLGPLRTRGGGECVLLRANDWGPDTPRTSARFIDATTSATEPLSCGYESQLRPLPGGFEPRERVVGDLNLQEASEGALVVVTWRITVSSTSLGCRPFSVVFCQPPLWTTAHLPDEVS